MSTTQRGRWYVPSTKIGRVLAGLYIVSAIAVLLPLYGIAFNQPVLLGPFPQAVTWSYVWFLIINLLLGAAYRYLFEPWAEHAQRYTDTLDAEEAETGAGAGGGTPADRPVADADVEQGGDD
jgi:hypothetical protein